jgi:hypothetical protein
VPWLRLPRHVPARPVPGWRPRPARLPRAPLPPAALQRRFDRDTQVGEVAEDDVLLRPEVPEEGAAGNAGPGHDLVDRGGLLGVETVEHPLGTSEQVEADPSGFTGVEGVWAAGNVLDVTAGVMQSAASGVTAAATMNATLTIEDAENAVSEAEQN